MKAFNWAETSDIKKIIIINIFVHYMKEKNCGNARLDYWKVNKQSIHILICCHKICVYFNEKVQNQEEGVHATRLLKDGGCDYGPQQTTLITVNCKGKGLGIL